MISGRNCINPPVGAASCAYALEIKKSIVVPWDSLTDSYRYQLSGGLVVIFNQPADIQPAIISQAESENRWFLLGNALGVCCEELPGKFGQPAILNCIPQTSHQRLVKIQVMHRGKVWTEHFLAPVEVL